MSDTAPENFIDLLQKQLDKRLGEILIGAVCSIEKFDGAKMLADVKPLLSRTKPDKSETDFPLLVNVPVNMIACGDYVIRPEYKQGDLVWVSFATYDISRPIRSQKATTGGGKFGLQNAYVVGSVMPFDATLPAAMASKSGLLIGHKSGGAIQQVLPDQFIFHFGTEKTIIDAGGVKSSGDFIANNDTVPLSFVHHGHATVMGPTMSKIPGGE